MAHPTRISVIIPCFNHGNYLARAIESVLTQPYGNVEIIVVDDGSVDNTREVAAQFPGVQYIHQQNQGLSAARNTGIENSEGEFLVFLDADDWLLKNALGINAAYLEHDRSLGFVSGAFLLSRNGVNQEVKRQVNAHHYLHLLQGNYISMHATVMYTRRALKNIRFDTALKACEDYDVYLRIARLYPVFHHTHLLAAYYHHDSNMSSDFSLMLDFSLRVLDAQEPLLRDAAERAAFEKGRRFWKAHYTEVMYARLVDTIHPLSSTLKKKFLHSLKTFAPRYYFKYIVLYPLMPFRTFLKKKPELA